MNRTSLVMEGTAWISIHGSCRQPSLKLVAPSVPLYGPSPDDGNDEKTDGEVPSDLGGSRILFLLF